MAVVVVIVEAVFSVATCPMEAADAVVGTAGLARDGESEASDTVLDEVAVTTSADTSGTLARGHCMLETGTLSAAIRISG